MRNLERNRLLDPSGRKQRSKLDLRATVPTKRLIGAMILLNYKADWTCALVAAIAGQEITGRDCWPTRIRHFVRQFSKFRTIEHIESTWEIWNWVRLNPPRDRLVQPEREGDPSVLIACSTWLTVNVSPQAIRTGNLVQSGHPLSQFRNRKTL